MRNIVKSLLISLMGLFLFFFVGVAVMIYGWGLEPKSWTAIILGQIATILIGAVMQIGMREE